MVYSVKCFTEIVVIAIFLSSKLLKISSVNFNMAGSILAPDIKPNYERIIYYYCRNSGRAYIIHKKVFINFTDEFGLIDIGR